MMTVDDSEGTSRLLVRSDAPHLELDRAALDRALNDSIRLAALRATDLIDTPAEEAFDRLSRLAARTLGTPIALVTLLDAGRQFFKSCIGLPEPWSQWRASPLSHSFCQHVVGTGQPLVVPDAREHPALHDNLAIRDFGVVAYLGIPLTVSDRAVIGSFCVIDHRRRDWTSEEVEVLRSMSQLVLTEIELRMHRNRLEAKVIERTAQLQQTVADLQREVAARAAAERQLAAALQEAERASQAKDRLLATVSHELRTPLTPILLYATSRERDPALDPQVRQDFAMIREQVQIEGRLIDDLLDAMQIERGALQLHEHVVVDVRDLLRSTISGMRGALEDKGLAVREEHAPDGRHRVRGDPLRLRQVFHNLLANAVRFSPAGGTITVRTTAVGASGGAHQLRITVADEGPGVDPALAGKVFNPFEHWTPSGVVTHRGGLGLGLTISRALVELHGGTLRLCDPTPGNGATFEITLTTVD